MNPVEEKDMLMFATMMALNGLVSQLDVNDPHAQEIENDVVANRAVDIGQRTVGALDEKFNELGLND